MSENAHESLKRRLPTLFGHQREGGTRTIVCLPPAGTGVSFHQGWVGAPARRSNLLTVQLPGRGSQLFDPPLVSLPEVAELIVPSVLADPHPVVLFGHSMGAWIAYELALRLQDRHEVAALAVSACPPPGSRIGAAAGLVGLSDEDFLAEVQRRFGEIPELSAASPRVRALMLPAMRADLAMCEGYRPVATPVLHCPVLSFAGTDDRIVTVTEVAAWASRTTGRYRGHTFPGGHLYLPDQSARVLAALEGHEEAVTSA